MTRTNSILAAGLMAVAVSASMAPAANAATNLLTNGSFSNALTSWTTAGTVTALAQTSTANAGNDPFTTAAGSPDAGGLQDVVFSTAGTGTLSQSINLIGGTVYSIGYDAAYYSTLGTAGGLSVTLNGVALAGLTITQAVFTGVNTWVEEIVSYRAPATVAGASLQISYTGATTPTKIAVDRAFVVATPEPSSAILLLSGGVGLWQARRRARRSTQQAA